MRKRGESQFPPPGPVYHGSPEGFAPGDVIEPRQDRTWMKGDDKAAFGTVHQETAGYFGLQQARLPWEGQGRLFSSVYEVEPMSHYDLHPSDQKTYDTEKKYNEPKGYPVTMPVNNMPIDRKGFRVKRHAAWAFPDPKGEAQGHLYEQLQETP